LKEQPAALAVVSHQRIPPGVEDITSATNGDVLLDTTNMDHDFDADFTLVPHGDTPDDGYRQRDNGF
jgi:hypothetical protein